MGTTSSKMIGICLILIQMADMFIHAAADQLEFIRVAANVIILLWMAVLLFGHFNSAPLISSLGAIGSYLLLNVVFLAREGFTNPTQGGSPRSILFALVLSTIVLSIVLAFKSNKKGAIQ